MKKLFSIKPNGFFWIVEENAVYSIFNKKENKTIFYDYNGVALSNYARPKVEEETCEDFICCDDEDEIKFNKDGVACVDGCLIDKNRNKLPDTELNCEDDCYEQNRYNTFAFLNEEQRASIAKCGTVENILVEIYDTKLRKFVAKGVPECVLSLFGYDGDSEVVLAAVNLVNQYDSIRSDGKGTIVAEKDGVVTVFDYYQN